GKFVLPDSAGKKVSTWDLLHGGNVAINLNLPKAYELVEKFGKQSTPPSTQPLKILDGAATVKLAIARDAAGQKTTLRDGEIVLDHPVFERNGSRYAPKGKAVA